MPQIVSIIIKGGIIMIPLLACSLISLALTIERILFWTKLKSKQALQEMLALVENGEFEQALKLRKSSPQPIARVLAAGNGLAPLSNLATSVESSESRAAADRHRHRCVDFIPSTSG